VKSGNRARRGLARAWLVAPAMLLVSAAVLAPTFIALIDSFQSEGKWTAANYGEFFLNAPYPQVLLNTLIVALIVTGVSLAAAAPVSAFLARQRLQVAGVAFGVIAASLWVPILVKTYSWEVLLAKAGPINALLLHAGVVDQPVPLLYTRLAVVLAMTQVMIPYATTILFAGMRRVDWELIVAARTLGASTWMVFAEVYWPQVRFTVVMASLVVFVVASSFFVTPALLGGPREIMLGMQMHSDLVNRYDSGMAATAGVVLTAILTLAAWLALKASGASFRRAATELAR
jgi:ABC-type spermidine/putrescine transport system permease subunit I